MPPVDGSAAPAAPLHLLKMAVGIASIDDLCRVRATRTRQLGGSWVYTRNQPRRAAAVLAGGSLYWVIRGEIRVRQRITGFRGERDDQGRAYCLIGVGRELVPTLRRPWRPFQGWRYLAASDAPPDAAGHSDSSGGAPGAAPEAMLAELRALGLL